MLGHQSSHLSKMSVLVVNVKTDGMVKNRILGKLLNVSVFIPSIFVDSLCVDLYKTTLNCFSKKFSTARQ